MKLVIRGIRVIFVGILFRGASRTLEKEVEEWESQK